MLGFLAPCEKLAGTVSSCRFHWLTWEGWKAWSVAISWIVLRPLIASMATLALNSGLWVRRLLNSCEESFANGGPPVWGGTPSLSLTIGAVQERQTTSGRTCQTYDTSPMFTRKRSGAPTYWSGAMRLSRRSLLRRSSVARALWASTPTTPPSPAWWGRRCWSSTSTGRWWAAACSPLRALPPSHYWMTSLHSRPSMYYSSSTQAADARGCSAPTGRSGLDHRPEAGRCNPRLHKPLHLKTHPRSDERLDKSTAPVHSRKVKCICSSKMTARNSNLLTL